MESASPGLQALVDRVGYSFNPDSMTPATTDAIVATARVVNATRMLELGAGLSTLALARYLAAVQHADAQLVTVEQDQAHADTVKAWLEKLELQQYVQIVVAPTKAVEVHGVKTESYAFEDCVDFPTGPFDLLVIDGPNGGGPEGKPFARLPTLPKLRDRLTDEAVVVLDDAFRDAELKAVEIWARAGQVKHIGVMSAGKGVYVGRAAS
jgi:predicted O-methyltransferase YrrM